MFQAPVAQAFRPANGDAGSPEGLRYRSSHVLRCPAIAASLIFVSSIAYGQAQNQSAAPATATIRGHVVAADSGLPLRKAQVRVVPMEPGAGASAASREPRSATTDADGKYELTGLAAGRYSITAFKTAYVNVTWGQSQTGVPGKPLEVHPGEVVDRLDFSLPRGAVFTGRVVDEYGEPLSNVQVSVVQARVINGRRELTPMNSGSTDDLGEFRIFGVLPAQYYVKATWRRTGMPADPTSADRTGYPETFFPGTVNVDEAQRFTVRAGQTIADLAIALSPVATARIEGTIVDVNGKPLPTAALMIGRTEGNNGFTMGAPVQPDGTFIIASLTPGEYTLRTQPMPPAKDVATMKLTVGAEDIRGLRLVAIPPSTISGRVIVDPAQAQSLPNPVMLTAMPSDGQAFGGMTPARVADDMSFEISAAPGRHRINWMNLAPGWSIRAIRVNNVDVTDDEIEVKAGENVSGVDVELTNKTATISGTVTSAGGTAAKDYTVLVFAADSRRWTPNSRYLRIARPDQDGRFKVTGLAPADYSVIAVDRIEVPGQWTDPEYLHRISPRANSVTVMEGENRVVELKIAAGS
jgi:Carboxypeptidase regulatory-like domain